MSATNERVRRLLAVAEELGFAYLGFDGQGHHALRHENGEPYRIAATPGDYRGDLNAIADMERISGRKRQRVKAGRSRKAVKASGFDPSRCYSTEATLRVEELRDLHEAQRREWQLLTCPPISRDDAARARALLFEITSTEAELARLWQPVNPIVGT